MMFAKRVNAMLVLSGLGFSGLGFLVLGFLVLGFGATTASGTPIAYVSIPSSATNGISTIPIATAYTSNLGYAFKTGPSGPFGIDRIKLQLYSGFASGTGTFKIWINGTDNETAYSAVASSTVYAADTVSYTLPGTANTPFDLVLAAADIPNISAYSLLSNTAYSLIVNSSSVNFFGLRRVEGLANGTTNGEYDVTNGFTMLDTFRNNTPNYTNTAGSYPAFAISFGTTQSAPVPEIDPSGVGSVLALVSGALGLLERRRLMALRA